MPRKPSAPSEPTLKMDDRYSMGDFSLISSDKCIFRIASKDILRRGNSTLRHAIKTCLAIPDTNNSIEFDEPATILRPFLNALLYSEAPPPSSFPVDRYYTLVVFATKLKAVGVVNLLRPLLPKYIMYKKSDPYPIFQSAVLFEDWCTAGDAIAKHSKDHVWYRDPKVKLASDLALGCKPRTYVLDPTGMPYHYWMQLPKRVSWALTRACSEKQGWKERGQKFTELMLFVDERDVVFPKWATMEAEAIIAASSDTSSGLSCNMDIAQEAQPNSRPPRPAAPSSIPALQTGLGSPPQSKTSTRIRLKAREPLFLRHSSSPEEGSSGIDRRRANKALATIGGASFNRDVDLLEEI